MIRQPYSVAIAMRYLRARSRNGFISFISAVSMLGIVLAVAVLIIVMAVINGFETELERRILSVSPDATLIGYDADAGNVAPIDDWRAFRAAALDHGEVMAAAPFVRAQGMLVAGNSVLGVNVRGINVELETEVSTIHERIVDGDFASLAQGWNIVIGRRLADELGVAIGDDATLVLPQAKVTLAGVAPRHKTFTVSGIFDVGMQEYDRGLVLISFDNAATLYRTNGRATGLSLRVVDLYNAQPVVLAVADEIFARELADELYPSDWSIQHSNIFRSIALTKPLLFILLSLVIAVAAFNIVSTMFMVVREKRGDIAILRSIGSAPRNILSIFIIQGSTIGLCGMLGGLVFGLLLVAYLGTMVGWVEAGLGIELFAGEVYLIDDLPTEARADEIARICVMAVLLAILATVLPAYRASRQPPAEALRHE